MKTKCILAAMVLLLCGSGFFAQASKPLQQWTIEETLDSWIAHTETSVVGYAKFATAWCNLL